MLGIDPVRSEAATIKAFVETLSSGREATVGRSQLRAIFERIDQDLAADALGLGDRSRILEPVFGTPLGDLVSAVINQVAEPRRRAVRKSALVRLFTWADSVGTAVTDLTAGDLDQFGRWVQDVGSGNGEIKVVAKDFIGLRSTPEGRRILGEPEPTPRALRLVPEAALKPRFALKDPFSFAGWDRQE